MINRHKLVSRHNPVHKEADVRAPLSVGNGEFAFTADITGLQSFYKDYSEGQPLCTQSQWGWHSNPKPARLSYEVFKMKEYNTPRGIQGFPTNSKGQEDLYTYLRQNPHRLHLGKIGMELLKTSGEKAQLENIKDINQILDIYNGILYSNFRLEEFPVRVETVCHPSKDQVAFSIKSDLLKTGRLNIDLDFPGPSPRSANGGDRYTLPDRWEEYITAADWSRPESHQTYYLETHDNCLVLLRALDQDRYFVRVSWEGNATIKQIGPHKFRIQPKPDSNCLKIAFEFQSIPFRNDVSSIKDIFIKSTDYWNNFWNSGGAIELANSEDSRALELERRIVLSQYLTAIHCAGSIPPQETGLMNNSWYGKYNLEMHWWHAYHFSLWGREHLLERSLWWYNKNLSRAKEMAKKQGLLGARWVKTYGPEAWDDAMPSGIGPLLIWCQPHPISFAEACYRAANPESSLRVIQKYKELVLSTAEYMADFVIWDTQNQRYILAPPIATAQEVHPPQTVLNPSFELSYWRYGLEIAQKWRERIGLGRDKKWDHVINNLSKLPKREGVYLAHENCQDTYTQYNYDHPSFLACLGVLPGKDVDRGIMANTLTKVINEWDLERKSWGWDYPMIAMTAARVGKPEIAISMLLYNSPQNQFLANGHSATRGDLPCYLPANGALLTAIALMASGWEGDQIGESPGFPKDGSWIVQHEGIRKY